MKISTLILIILTAILLSISQPVHAQGISYLGSTLWSGACDIKVPGHYAYCAFFNGLMILDISNPFNPVFISQYYTGGHYGSYQWGIRNRLFLSGEYLYFSADYNGLQIINISDPSNPILTGRCLFPTNAYGVYATPNYVYVTCGPIEHHYSSLQIINMADPANPVIVGSCETPGGGDNVIVRGNYAYTVGGGGGITIVDISNPANPIAMGSCPMGYATDAALSGDYAYISDGHSLSIANISDPANPTLVGRWSNPNIWAGGVFVAGNYAYLVTDIGLGIFDISDPANPIQVGGLAGGGSCEAFISGSYAYIAAFTNGFQVVNISNPTNPVLAGTYPAPAAVIDAYIQGNYAYLATGQTGLKIVDITDPANMPVVGSWVSSDFFDRPNACFVSGNYAYLGTNGSLRIIDVSNPANPVAVGRHDFPDYTTDVSVVGPYAYVGTYASYGHGFYIMDISNPSNPIVVGTYDIPNAAWNLQIIDNYAYIACAWLYILDISDRTNPTFVGRYSPLDGGIRGVCVYGEYAYLAHSSRLEVVDISDRAHPVRIGYSLPAMGWPTTVEVRGNYVLLSESRGSDFDRQGLQIFDVTEKNNPVLVDELETPGEAYTVIARGDNQIFLADEFSLMALQFDMTGIHEVNPLPKEFSLFQNYPNPFNAQTSISYSLPKTGPVNISIYNLLGQKVATLSDGIQQAGEHNIIWNAKGNPSGVYFAKLKSGDQTKNVKMVLLK